MEAAVSRTSKGLYRVFDRTDPHAAWWTSDPVPEQEARKLLADKAVPDPDIDRLIAEAGLEYSK